MSILPDILAFVPSWLLPLILSILVAVFCSWIAIMIARKTGLIDIPGTMPHKKHAVPTPLAGGIALIAAFFILSPLLGTWSDKNLSTVLIGAMGIFVFGLIDDRYGLSAPQKLFGQGLVVLFLITQGISVRFLESTEFYIGGPLLLYQVADWLVTAFWLVGIINAFNMVDSMDGLALGLACNSLVFLLIGAFIASQSLLSLHMIALLGICLGIYAFNRRPARLFLGDSGAQTLGYFLAVFSILYSPVGGWQGSSWFFPILVLGVPIFDTCLVVYSRIRRHKPFYKSSLDHTYHRLVSAGLSPVRANILIQGSSILLGILGFTALRSPVLTANLIFAGCLVLGLLALTILERPRYLAYLSQTQDATLPG